MNVIEYESVHRSYANGKPALQGVSFAVESGEVVGLLGRNGAGKTTLLRATMGMLAPQEGSVRVFGKDPRSEPLEVKRRVGYVSEEQVLPRNSTVAEVLLFHRALFPTWDAELERDYSARFDLDPGARIKELSKGEARRVAFVCAAAHRPELLVLDEPAGGLDPAARREFLEAALSLSTREGASILFSSHHMNDVERIASRVVMLDEGRVLVACPMDELREETSLCVMPALHVAGAVTGDEVRALDGCLGVRERAGKLHAVLRGAPDAMVQLLEREFGVRDASCASLPLEELFIELVGGRP